MCYYTHMILGLDLSTTICGWCLLDKQGKYVDAGYIQFDKTHNLYQKMLHLHDQIVLEYRLSWLRELTHVFIEEPVLMFGKSTAHVISLLQRFNGMSCAMLALNLHLNPILVNASHARKLCDIKKIKDKKAKDTVFEHVKASGVFPEEKWEFKKSGEIKDCCKDMTDAYIVAYAGYLEYVKDKNNDIEQEQK
jgi:hypothetical protein